MARNNRNDEISELLDSYIGKTELNIKMDQFQKDKLSRTDKRSESEIQAEIEPEVVSSPDATVQIEPLNTGSTIDETATATIQPGYGDTRVVIEESQAAIPEAEKTMTAVWKPEEMSTTDGSNKTVVISDNKIKELLEDTSKEKQVKNIKRKSNDESKTIGRVAMIVLAVIVGCALIFGAGRFVWNLFQNEIISSDSNEYYNELKEWAENYDTYSDEEKARITEYEQKYNQMTDDQKQKINEILKEKAGSSFDTLLAKAKSGTKTDSTNNNTKKAEEKAKLKEEIATYQSGLNTANETLAQAQTAYNEAQAKFDSANTAYTNAQSAVDGINSEIAELEGRLDGASEDEKSEIEAQIRINRELIATYDLNTLLSNLESAQSALNQAQSDLDAAQADVNYYVNQITPLQEKLNALDEE